MGGVLPTLRLKQASQETKQRRGGGGQETQETGMGTSPKAAKQKKPATYRLPNTNLHFRVVLRHHRRASPRQRLIDEPSGRSKQPHVAHKNQNKREVQKRALDVLNGVREKWFVVSRHNKCTPGDMDIDPTER